MITMRCKKHPAYKAIYKPTAECADCEQLWKLTQKNPGLVYVAKKRKLPSLVQKEYVHVSSPSFIDDQLMRMAYANETR